MSGETVTVRAFKSDATNYRWWQATVERVEDDCIVTYAPPHRPVYEIDGKWISRATIRAHYWRQRPYNLLELYELDGSLGGLYIHISSPVRIAGRELHYTDYELDVVFEPGREPEIVDEDEFASASRQYSYSSQFQIYCYTIAQEVLAFVRDWTPGGAKPRIHM